MATFSDAGSSLSISTCQTQDAAGASSERTQAEGNTEGQTDRQLQRGP